MTTTEPPHLHPTGQSALYLAGALDPADEFAFERHLARCARCRDECAELGPAATALALAGFAGFPARPVDSPDAGRLGRAAAGETTGPQRR
ncbi:zf-HC2 domain-containing protein [Micromonospora marina]|uniref:zf-HC2 domain-containing protein n=1 Tax=Micromonospora marina TaxID=307120 RepID=UPI003455DD6E